RAPAGLPGLRRWLGFLWYTGARAPPRKTGEGRRLSPRRGPDRQPRPPAPELAGLYPRSPRPPVRVRQARLSPARVAAAGLRPGGPLHGVRLQPQPDRDALGPGTLALDI